MLLDMLERVAMHQTRLRAPGLHVDPKGVVLGSRLLILLASVERLVAFFSLYSSAHSLSAELPSMRIEVLRSSVGNREVALSMDVSSSEQADSFAQTARVVGGFSFTGTDRHYVQSRDAAAPFGYDIPKVLIDGDADYVLYHNSFTQTYNRERFVGIQDLLEQLQLHVDISEVLEGSDQVWVVADRGVGEAVIHYFVRSNVKAQVGLVQWPPESALDDGPVERYVFRIDKLPARMRQLVQSTPGLAAFRQVGPGVAVQVGYRHSVNLRAFPIFDPAGLTLFRGGAQQPLRIQRLPTLGPVMAFAQIQRGPANQLRVLGNPTQVRPVLVPPRLMPSQKPLHDVRATHLPPDEYQLLRRMAYRLPGRVLQRARVAFTDVGAFLLQPDGVDGIPLGVFLTEIKPTLYVAAGYEPVPSVADDVLFATMGSPSSHVVFWTPRVGIVGVPTSAFSPLESALSEAQRWAPVRTVAIDPLPAPGGAQLMYEQPPDASGHPRSGQV